MTLADAALHFMVLAGQANYKVLIILATVLVSRYLPRTSDAS